MFDFNKLIGGMLNSISRVCGLIKLGFLSLNGETVCIHSQGSLLRVLKNNRLVLSSEDLFVPGLNIMQRKIKNFRVIILI